MVRYMGQLSQTHGLGDLWAQHQPEIQRLIDSRAECAKEPLITRIMYVKTAENN